MDMELHIEKADVATSCLFMGRDQARMVIPSWLPKSLKSIYMRHELGHLNFIDLTGKHPKNPLDPIIHNLQAFRFEFCPCSGRFIGLLMEGRSIEFADSFPADSKMRSFICDGAPMFSAPIFILVAILTMFPLRLIHPSCLRGGKNCLLKRVKRSALTN